METAKPEPAKVLRPRERPPAHEFRPARRPVPEYYERTQAAGVTSRGLGVMRAKTGGVNFGSDSARAGHRSGTVGTHVYHHITEPAHFTMKATPMMFGNDYRPGRKVDGYGCTKSNYAHNVITGEGLSVPVDKHRRRIEGAPSTQLQKMNDQQFHLPAEREVSSPRRAAKEEKEPQPARQMGKKVHGTARREAKIQEFLVDERRPPAPAGPVSAPASSPAHFADTCAATRTAVQERRLWGQIFKARGQDSMKLG